MKFGLTAVLFLSSGIGAFAQFGPPPGGPPRPAKATAPEDLTGYLLHISLGKHRCTAWVSRTNGPKPRERTWSR